MNKKILGTALILLSSIPLVFGISVLKHMSSGDDIDYSWILPQIPPVVFLLVSLTMFIYGLWALLPWPKKEE